VKVVLAVLTILISTSIIANEILHERAEGFLGEVRLLRPSKRLPLLI